MKMEPFDGKIALAMFILFAAFVAFGCLIGAVIKHECSQRPNGCRMERIEP